MVSSLSDDASFIQISGHESHLNSALADLIYLPSTHFNGEDSLVFTAYDSSPSPLSSVLSVPVTIHPVNDPPQSQSTTITLNEDQPYLFNLVDFYFEDVDDGDSLKGVEITSLPRSGTISER